MFSQTSVHLGGVASFFTVSVTTLLSQRENFCLSQCKRYEFKDYTDFMRVWLLIDLSGVCQVTGEFKFILLMKQNLGFKGAV